MGVYKKNHLTSRVFGDRHNPSNAQIASSLGNVLHAKREHADALKNYQLAIQLNPLDTITHNNMGIVLQTIGEVPRAILAYKASFQGLWVCVF